MQEEKGRQLGQSSWDDLSVWGGTHGSGFLAQGQAYHRPGEGCSGWTPPNAKNLPDLPGRSQAAERVCLAPLFPSPPLPRALGWVLQTQNLKRGSVEGRWVGKDREQP